jgi:DNA polymerase-3 subunit epsilon
LCHLDQSSGACFPSQFHSCHGACTGQENAESYNSRLRKAISGFRYSSDNFFIIDQGRTDDERTVVKVEKGKYIGFGFISEDIAGFNPDNLHDCIKRYKDNRDVRTILHN